MESFASKQYLLDMVEIGDGTAEGIYPAVHISMENIIGYSSETTNVMFGEHHSVSKLLTTEYPNVSTVKCSKKRVLIAYIVEYFLALQHYFALVANEDPTHANDHILKLLHDKLINFGLS